MNTEDPTSPNAKTIDDWVNEKKEFYSYDGLAQHINDVPPAIRSEVKDKLKKAGVKIFGESNNGSSSSSSSSSAVTLSNRFDESAINSFKQLRNKIITEMKNGSRKTHINDALPEIVEKAAEVDYQNAEKYNYLLTLLRHIREALDRPPKVPYSGGKRKSTRRRKSTKSKRKATRSRKH